MIAFIKRLFCKHYKVTFIRNVYGDEINDRNCRSLWRCGKCGATVRCDHLHHSETEE